MDDVSSKPVQRATRRWRLIVLLALGILIVGAGLGYVQFWLARPIGSGPAGPAVSPSGFQPWTNRRLLLLGIGDSVTVALEPAAATGT